MKTILLDRDGVLNPLLEHPETGEPVSPQHPDQFELFLGARHALRMARENGFQIVVFTNQPDVEKEWRNLTGERLDEMHSMLQDAGVDAVYACTHGPLGDRESKRYGEDGDIVVCNCRKPQPGLIEQAVSGEDITVSESYVIGDRDEDMEAAERYEAEHDESFVATLRIGDMGDAADRTFYNLAEAVRWIIEDA